MNISQLQKLIERYFAAGPSAIGDSSAMDVFVEFRAALERGDVRAASPDTAAATGWRVNLWVGSSRVDLQACKLEYSIVSPK